METRRQREKTEPRISLMTLIIKKKFVTIRVISGYFPPCLRVSIIPYLMLLSLAGCSATGPSTDALFASANSQLSSAQKAGAEQLAESDFEEAVTLLSGAETALKNRDKQARSLVQKAHAKARLVEALARQLKAENEAAQLEAELEKAREEATRARLERRAAEDELGNVF